METDNLSAKTNWLKLCIRVTGLTIHVGEKCVWDTVNWSNVVYGGGGGDMLLISMVGKLVHNYITTDKQIPQLMNLLIMGGITIYINIL